VSRKSSSPEISPSQVPARERICRCIAFKFFPGAGSETNRSAASRNTAVGVVLAASAFDFNFRASFTGSRIVNVVVIHLNVLHLKIHGNRKLDGPASSMPNKVSRRAIKLETTNPNR